MSKRPVNIEFKVNKPARGNGKFTLILILCVVLVLSASLLIVFGGMNAQTDIYGALGIDVQTESETQAQELADAPEGERTYLLWCAEDGELEFAWLVNFVMPERRVNVCALNISSVPEGGTQSLKQFFASEGKKGLSSYIERSYGVKTDGYIGSNPEQFKVMINYFGGIDTTVNEQIEYRSEDMALVLVKGRQNLKGDSFYKYVRYLSLKGDEGQAHLSSALNEVLSDVFVPSNAERGTNIFSKISNTLDTDLTIVDFSLVEQAAACLAENGIAVKTICKTPEELV